MPILLASGRWIIELKSVYIDLDSCVAVTCKLVRRFVTSIHAVQMLKSSGVVGLVILVTDQSCCLTCRRRTSSTFTPMFFKTTCAPTVSVSARHRLMLPTWSVTGRSGSPLAPVAPIWESCDLLRIVAFSSCTTARVTTYNISPNPLHERFLPSASLRQGKEPCWSRYRYCSFRVSLYYRVISSLQEPGAPDFFALLSSQAALLTNITT